MPYAPIYAHIVCLCMLLLVYTVQDWEIIEPAAFDQLGRSSAVEKCQLGEKGEGRWSPQVISPRERWKRAIEQLIMLQRMEKENQTIMSKSLLVYSLFRVYPSCINGQQFTYIVNTHTHTHRG